MTAGLPEGAVSVSRAREELCCRTMQAELVIILDPLVHRERRLVLRESLFTGVMLRFNACRLKGSVAARPRP